MVWEGKSGVVSSFTFLYYVKSPCSWVRGLASSQLVPTDTTLVVEVKSSCLMERPFQKVAADTGGEKVR